MGRWLVGESAQEPYGKGKFLFDWDITIGTSEPQTFGHLVRRPELNDISQLPQETPERLNRKVIHLHNRNTTKHNARARVQYCNVQ